MIKRLEKTQHRGKGRTKMDIISFLLTKPNGAKESEIRDYLAENFGIHELKGIRERLDGLNGIITKRGNLYKLKSSYSKEFKKEFKEFLNNNGDYFYKKIYPDYFKTLTNILLSFAKKSS